MSTESASSQLFLCEQHRWHTAYVRITVRSSRTHHKTQQWVPFGKVCLVCHSMVWAPGEEKAHRQLREATGRKQRAGPQD